MCRHQKCFFRTAGVPEEKFGGRGGADPVTSLSRVNSAGYKTTTIAQDYYFKDFLVQAVPIKLALPQVAQLSIFL